MAKKTNILKQTRSGFKTGQKVTKSFIGIYKKYFKSVRKTSSFLETKITDPTGRQVSHYSVWTLGIALGVCIWSLILIVAFLDVKSK